MAKRRGPTVQLKGTEDLQRQLVELGSVKSVQRVQKAAMNAATQVFLKAIRRLMPVESGLLKKSLAKKISAKGLKVKGIVGSDVSVIGPDGVRAARHLHLVEKGFQHESGKVVPGQFPVRRGFEAGKAQALSVYQQKLSSGIAKEVARTAKLGRNK